MDLGLKGKVALVTGGGWGMAKAACLTFAEEGSSVVVADLDVGRATEVAHQILAAGGKALAVKADVTSWSDVQGMVAAAVKEFGQLDILANVAGAWRINYFMKMEREDWDVEIDVNYRGMLNCTRAALEHMIPRKSGCILSVASDAARTGEPNQPVYSGAKAAVIGFSKALAKDVARHGIRVNVVCASLTVGERRIEMEEQMRAAGDEAAIKAYDEAMARALKMYPLRKFGKPQDIANTLVFVASDLRCGHLTGQTISVNGGYVMP